MTVDKPPTGEQLRAVSEAENLFRSNSFKLQIDALLPHVRPKLSRRPPLDRFLLELHALLLEIPSVPPEHPLVAARRLLKNGISVPYSLPLPTESTNWKVAFEKPADITLVGSWPNELCVKGNDAIKFGVDLAIEMPQTLFQEKDYLNGRFFHKHAFYLATIAEAIMSCKDRLNVEVTYDTPSTDSRLTTLVLSPLKSESPLDFSKLNAYVRILLALSSSSPILLARLSPSQSSLRISPSDMSTQTPTPLYNTALLKTLTPKSDLLSNHDLKRVAPAFRDALTLLRVWANQRGYGDGTRLCVRGFEKRGPLWSAVLGLLIDGEESTVVGTHTRRLGRGLSSYQLFKAALDFLVKQNFAANPIYLKTKRGHRFLPEEYQTRHDAVLVDSSSTVNLLVGIPPCSLDMLRHDARVTLEVLDKSRDPFASVFLEDKRDLCTRFDTVMQVKLSATTVCNASLHCTLDHGSSTEALLTSLSFLLRRGLGNRTKAIAILHPSPTPRPVSRANQLNLSIIHIGLVHDQEHALRLVDHGPSVVDEDRSASEEFREFWGDKAELRRFKDGRITESVVWDVKTSDERAHIPSIIVRHILGRHLGVTDEAILSWKMPFDAVLKLPEPVSRLVHATSSTATGFKGALLAFDDLVKALKSLGDDVPLTLLNVKACSEYLRYTSVFTPIPASPVVAYMPLMEIVLEFEKSSKWPDDLNAIQKVKLAFFERIAAALMTSVTGLKATIVVDGARSSEIQDQARLEIVTPSGWAFSAQIWHDREAALLDRFVDEKVVPPRVTPEPETDARECQLALTASQSHTRRFIHAPRHHRAVASLCHRYSAYAGTVRLTKRWLASHWLLGGHVTEEAVELVCASLFIGGTSGSPKAGIPGSKERGFATVVEFLKRWKWENGLFISLYDEPEVNGSLGRSRAGERVGSNAGVWSLSTKWDRDGHMWTSRGPDITAAHRVRSLAMATWEHLLEMESGTLDVKALFVHPTEDYDFIIQLDTTVLPRYYQNVTLDGLSTRPLNDYSCVFPRPGFDPAQLLFNDLQFLYTDTLKLFYDPFGGDRFGAIWDPSLKSSRPFRVLSGFSSKPCNVGHSGTERKSLALRGHDKTRFNGMVMLNENAVLEEIGRIGKGIIKSMIVLRHVGE